MTSQSQAIVDFIASLDPLYAQSNVDGMRCAVALSDGTVIAPTEETDEIDEKGWVVIYWQGERTRKLEYPGSPIASQAVLRYVELLGIGRPVQEIASQRDMLIDHFAFKTGASLNLEQYVEDSELFQTLRKGVKILGANVIINLIKHAAGLI